MLAKNVFFYSLGLLNFQVWAHEIKLKTPPLIYFKLELSQECHEKKLESTG